MREIKMTSEWNCRLVLHTPKARESWSLEATGIQVDAKDECVFLFFAPLLDAPPIRLNANPDSLVVVQLRHASNLILAFSERVNDGLLTMTNFEETSRILVHRSRDGAGGAVESIEWRVPLYRFKHYIVSA